MEKENFEKWLISNDHKTTNSAYSYKQAIPYVSKHYSDFKGVKIDFYNSDITTLKEGVELYGLNGKFSDYGNKGNGTYRNAMNALLRMKESSFEKSSEPTISQNALQEFWIKYKEYFKLPASEHQEKYKWPVLKQVYDKWDWNVGDKSSMFKNAFDVKGQKNLWLSTNFYPISHTSWMLDNFPNETINGLENLFNEDLPLLERVNSFIELYERKLPELQNLVPDKKINYHSHGDLRAIALYLTLQYPEKYFLFKFTMVNDFLKKIGLEKIKGGETKNLETYLGIANQTLDFIKQDAGFISEYRNFTNQNSNYNDESLHLLTQDFIYTIATHFESDEPKYWRIGSSDGEGTSYLNEMFNSRYVAIGWNDIGDLSQQNINNKKDIIPLLEKSDATFKNNNVKSRKAGEIFDFYSNVSPGDIVCLMNGNSVYAIGKIDADYSYDDTNTKSFAHFRDVQWLKSNITNVIVSDGPQTTCYQLTKGETINRIRNIINQITINSDLNTINAMSAESYPLNQILFGPPGTGKTYLTKKLAVEIIEDKKYSHSQEDRVILNEAYSKYLNLGLITFSTFHQSMSYEDFIEGIKPKMNTGKNGEIEYEVKDGIFKQICQNAAKKETANFDEAYSKLIKDIVESEKEYLVLYTPRKKEFRVNVNSNGNLTLYTTKNINQYGTITSERLYDFYLGADVFSGWEGYAKGILDHLEKKYNLSKESKAPNEKYVLIIDEINRGNISSIFGELITLIENDKRAGQKEMIQLILPYSNEKFSVPDNVHIIGTMNTADRSVEALDTALRRRFSFVEVVPDTTALKNAHNTDGIISYNGQDINLNKLLDTINGRIELLIDKDHKIGHSYFINVQDFEELTQTFSDKVIPLLEEYFYGDFGKIGLVLGKAFVSDENQKLKKVALANFDHDDREIFNDKKLFCLTESNSWKPISFQSIYDNSIRIDE